MACPRHLIAVLARAFGTTDEKLLADSETMGYVEEQVDRMEDGETLTPMEQYELHTLVENMEPELFQTIFDQRDISLIDKIRIEDMKTDVAQGLVDTGKAFFDVTNIKAVPKEDLKNFKRLYNFYYAFIFSSKVNGKKVPDAIRDIVEKSEDLKIIKEKHSRGEITYLQFIKLKNEIRDSYKQQVYAKVGKNFPRYNEYMKLQEETIDRIEANHSAVIAKLLEASPISSEELVEGLRL